MTNLTEIKNKINTIHNQIAMIYVKEELSEDYLDDVCDKLIVCMDILHKVEDVENNQSLKNVNHENKRRN